MSNLIRSEMLTDDNADRIVEDNPNEPVAGRWFWLKPTPSLKDQTPHLWCIEKVGSNFVHFQRYDERQYDRLSFAEFYERATRELNAEEISNTKVNELQAETKRLMAEVQTTMGSLHVGQAGVNETQALQRVDGSAAAIPAYKNALVTAKDKILPDLFKEIKETTEAIAHWMKLPLVGMKVGFTQQKPLMEAIEGRIFNIDLYAGLSEQLIQIQDGKTAEHDAKIHIFQRRHYMDEESLLNYKVGGMNFNQIEKFDAWLLDAENLNRILPFDRSVVAFRVRRYDRRSDENVKGMEGIMQLMFEREQDRKTFLYFRNGQKVFRLTTSIDFGEKLFPDMEDFLTALSGTMYVKHYNGQNPGFITEGDFLQRKEVYEKKLATDRLKGGDNLWHLERENPAYEWKPFSKDDLYYDELMEQHSKEMEKHNRVILLLQGILDRTPVMHPHPKWQLWEQNGFEQALKPVYDVDMALVSGPPPSFEAYRDRLAETLVPGCRTIGQQEVWCARELRKEQEAARYRGFNVPTTYYGSTGNPGPGTVAIMRKGAKGKAKFNFVRESVRYPYDPVKDTIEVSFERLLNVEAYQLGDYKQFFQDPRTRADYMKWAPSLLRAEEEKTLNTVTKEKADAAEATLPVRKKKKKPMTIAELQRLQDRLDAIVARAQEGLAEGEEEEDDDENESST